MRRRRGRFRVAPGKRRDEDVKGIRVHPFWTPGPSSPSLVLDVRSNEPSNTTTAANNNRSRSGSSMRPVWEVATRLIVQEWEKEREGERERESQRPSNPDCPQQQPHQLHRLQRCMRGGWASLDATNAAKGTHDPVRYPTALWSNDKQPTAVQSDVSGGLSALRCVALARPLGTAGVPGG
ncbi:hypothetical protein Ct61P_07319 [Colletotrichum tofieldiae]|nr:hypothetical protein Ct61P_07319 [Colletotrichum tofieldiae]